jgi:membrane protein implicated in regulation of membrane protease activity
MEMSDATWWWIATGLLVVLELSTLTFYLLMLSFGTVVGALAAHAGMDVSGQMIAASVIGAGAVVICYFKRKRRPGQPPARAERSVNLDIDSVVHIKQWNEDGAASVDYRGANWTALLRPGSEPSHNNAYRVVELTGNCLIVEPA